MTIGERIKLERMSRNITLTDFANRVGISKQSLYKYEKGIITNIPLTVITTIAVLLDVSPAYLMGWIEDKLVKQELEFTVDENNLIAKYRTLNSDGKDKAQEYVSDLTTMSKYTTSSKLRVSDTV